MELRIGMENPVVKELIPISVGQLLKEAREAHGLSLESVATTLCISLHHLAKLEDDHESLVCDVYTLGFLRSYAKLLNLNGNILIQKFKDQVAPLKPSEFILPTPIPEKGMPGHRVLIISLALFGLISAVAGFQWWRLHHSTSPSLKVPPLSFFPSKKKS